METLLQKLKRESGKLTALGDACERTLSTATASPFDSVGIDTSTASARPTTLEKNVAVAWHETDVFVPLSQAVLSRQARLAVLALDGIEVLWSSAQCPNPCSLTNSDSTNLELATAESNREPNQSLMRIQVNILQLLATSWLFYSNCSEVLTRIVKVLLSLCSVASARPSTDQLMSVVDIYIKISTKVSHTTVQTACRASLNQLIETLCKDAAAACGSDIHQANKGGLDRYNAVVVFICGKILTARSGQVGKSREQAELQSCLDFFFRLLSFTPFIFTTQDSFLDVIQNSVCVMLVSLLNPTELSETKTGGRTGKMMFRKSDQNCLTSTCFQLCCLISVELVRLVGSISAAALSLASVFHQLLLGAPATSRAPAIELCLGKVVSSPSRLLDFCGPRKGHNKFEPHSDGDLDLLRLLLPTVVDTVKTGGQKFFNIAVQTALSLLTSLQQIVDMKDIEQEVLERLNNGVGNMKGSDILKQQTGCKFDETVSGIASTLPLIGSESEDVTSAVSHFVDSLAAILPSLLEASTTQLVDQMLQNFASKFFLASTSNDRETAGQILFLNADVVYATLYAVMMLNYQLLSSGFYAERKTPEFMLQVQFAEQLTSLCPGSCFPREGSDQIVRSVMNCNLLAVAGWPDISSDKDIVIPLIRLLTALLGKEVEGADSSTDEDIGKAGQLKQLLYEIAQRILDVAWSSLLDILSLPFQTSVESSSVFRIGLGHSNSSASITPLCLKGLRLSVRLCCRLDMQGHCADAFLHMVDMACTNEGKEVRLSSSAVLCMEALLDTAVQCASKSPDCWQHVFRCCQYICELERAAFAAMQTPRSPTTVESNVTNILLKSLSDKELYDNHLLEPAQARSVLSLLSGMVESVCDQACDTLSWHELKTFVQLLCNTVRKGLGHGGAYGHCHLSKSNSLSLSVGLQLRWIADVLTRFAADDQRPLLHLVILWSMASETLVQATCHADRQIAKDSVALLHDIMSRVLVTYKEKPGFTVQEMMFRSLETLLALQLVDSDTEHQVVTSICELVEASTTEIKSGWQPVFRAICAVKHTPYTSKAANITQNRKNSTRNAVLEVVAAVLNHGDPSVFAEAAIPCVQCLLKLLLDELPFVQNISEELETSEMTFSQESFSCALDNLSRVAKALSTIFAMCNRPKFRGAERICLLGHDAVVRELLSMLDMEGSGILIVWTVLLNGLAEIVPQCEGSLQNEIASLLFSVLRILVEAPGLSFFAYILTSVMLPVLSSWAVSRGWDHESAVGFSHVAGQTLDLIAEQLPKLGESGDSLVINLVPDIIKKMLELTGVLIVQEDEKITRVGCSTFRLLIGCCQQNLRHLLLQPVCSCLAKSMDASLDAVKSLINRYEPESASPKGKDDDVKVVSRKNTSEGVVRRSLHLAEQVFIATASAAAARRKRVRLNVDDPLSDEVSHSLAFVIPETDDKNIKRRISFRRLVVSLVSHQLLLQMAHDLLIFSVTPSASMELSEILCLIDSIVESCIVAVDFDSRPALQLTVSKLAVMEPVLASLAKQAAMGVNVIVQLVKEAARLAMDISQQTSNGMEDGSQEVSNESVGHNNSDLRSLPTASECMLLNCIVPYFKQVCHTVFDHLLFLHRVNQSDKTPSSIDYSYVLPAWGQVAAQLIQCINDLPSTIFQTFLGSTFGFLTELVTVIQDDLVRDRVKTFFIKVGAHYHILDQVNNTEA